MALDSLVWVEAAPKVLVYVGLLLGVGACGVKRLVLPRVEGLAGGAFDACDRRLARLLRTAATVAAVGLGWRLLAHTYAVFGAEEWLSVQSLWVIGVESRWGRGWRVEAFSVAVWLSATLLTKRHTDIGWHAATIGILAACFAAPLIGHAAGHVTRLALHAIHILGAGLWLGTLAAIVVACHPRARFLEVFSPVALAGAGLVTSAGVMMALQYLGTVSDLWITTYGGTLAAKLTIVAAIALCGYFNWHEWRGATGTSANAARATEARRSGRLAVIEVLLALGVVLVTALLTELEHPL
jgi:putative copper export protein